MEIYCIYFDLLFLIRYLFNYSLHLGITATTAAESRSSMLLLLLLLLLLFYLTFYLVYDVRVCNDKIIKLSIIYRFKMFTHC